MTAMLIDALPSLVFTAARAAWRLGIKVAQKRKRQGGTVLEDPPHRHLIETERLDEMVDERVEYHMREVYQYKQVEHRAAMASRMQGSAVGLPDEGVGAEQAVGGSLASPQPQNPGRAAPSPRQLQPAAAGQLASASSVVAVTPISGRRGLIIAPPALRTAPAAASSLPGLPSPRHRTDKATVHLFWDIDNKHPGALDPRLLCHSVRRALGSYGAAVNIYAYGIRKAFSWVPDAFVEQYVSKDSAMDDLMSQGLALRCALCGSFLKSEESYKRHLIELHGKTVKEVKLMQQQGSSTRNTHNKTLGRVAQYHNSRGAAFLPPQGHQISLKYVLLKEGAEVRMVQNSREAADEAINEGIAKLLRALQLEGSADQQHVLCLMSDNESHHQALQNSRRMGISTVAVCSETPLYTGADVTLDWDSVKHGEYL